LSLTLKVSRIPDLEDSSSDIEMRTTPSEFIHTNPIEEQVLGARARFRVRVRVRVGVKNRVRVRVRVRVRFEVKVMVRVGVSFTPYRP
jgi:hypothetical protein